MLLIDRWLGAAFFEPARGGARHTLVQHYVEVHALVPVAIGQDLGPIRDQPVDADIFGSGHVPKVPRDRRGARVWPLAKLLIAQRPEQLRDQLLVKGSVSKQERLRGEYRVT